MPDLTPEQEAAQKKLAEQLAARQKAAAELKAKRDAYRANIGKSFTNGEIDATVTGFDKHHYADGIWGEVFIVNFGNPNLHLFKNCDKFLAEFQLKGAVS